MSERKKPMDRAMLRSFKNEKHYIEKLEKVIVEQGKQVLYSVRKGFIIVSNDNIQKFIKNNPKIGTPRWHQVRIQSLYNNGIINVSQRKLLIAMKQILNKRGDYLLMQDEFDKKHYVLNCKEFDNRDICHQHSCPATHDCVKYYKKDVKKND